MADIIVTMSRDEAWQLSAAARAGMGHVYVAHDTVTEVCDRIDHAVKLADAAPETDTPFHV